MDRKRASIRHRAFPPLNARAARLYRAAIVNARARPTLDRERVCSAQSRFCWRAQNRPWCLMRWARDAVTSTRLEMNCSAASSDSSARVGSSRSRCGESRVRQGDGPPPLRGCGARRICGANSVVDVGGSQRHSTARDQRRLGEPRGRARPRSRAARSLSRPSRRAVWSFDERHRSSELVLGPMSYL
jgi:hypothetical protein